MSLAMPILISGWPGEPSFRPDAAPAQRRQPAPHTRDSNPLDGVREGLRNLFAPRR